MLRLLVFYLHHALLHLQVFSGREKGWNKKNDLTKKRLLVSLSEVLFGFDLSSQVHRTNRETVTLYILKQLSQLTLVSFKSIGELTWLLREKTKTDEEQNSPGWEEANNRVKLLPLAELGGLSRQLGANVDTLGVELSICFKTFSTALKDPLTFSL